MDMAHNLASKLLAETVTTLKLPEANFKVVTVSRLFRADERANFKVVTVLSPLRKHTRGRELGLCVSGRPSGIRKE